MEANHCAPCVKKFQTKQERGLKTYATSPEGYLRTRKDGGGVPEGGGKTSQWGHELSIRAENKITDERGTAPSLNM